MNALKIFIWEPQPVIAMDIKYILTKAKYEARIIRPRDEILPLIIEEKPELFILCPDLDFRITVRLVSIFQGFNIPILIISGISKNILDKYIDLADIVFISKPFCGSELISCIRDNPDKKHRTTYRKEYNSEKLQLTKKIAEFSYKNLLLN